MHKNKNKYYMMHEHKQVSYMWYHIPTVCKQLELLACPSRYDTPNPMFLDYISAHFPRIRQSLQQDAHHRENTGRLYKAKCK